MQATTATRPGVDRVEVTRAPSSRAGRRDSLDADLQKAQTLANLLDAQFEFAGVKFGLDAVIGLLPVAGDVVSAVLGAYPIAIARKHRLGKLLIGRMVGNLVLDFTIGVVPLIGDVADVGFKANLRNVKLLKAAAEKQRSKLG